MTVCWCKVCHGDARSPLPGCLRPSKHECPDCGTRHWTPQQRKLEHLRTTTCAHCGRICGDSYMVHDELWAKADVDRGVLHLRCLQIRLGRKLTLGDFTNYPINETIKFAVEVLA